MPIPVNVANSIIYVFNRFELKKSVADHVKVDWCHARSGQILKFS